MEVEKSKIHYRTVILSDIHLGSRNCSADKLLEFLKSMTCDTLILNGDILDFWALSRGIYWPQAHTDVLRKILKMNHKGTKVIYVSGNHDETIRQFTPLIFGDIEVVDELIYESFTGKKILILHGDKYDTVVQYARWLAVLGDIGYELLMKTNRYVNTIRKMFGYEYWSFSAFVKHKVKEAVSFISKFEESLAAEAKRRGLDSVAAGHIHEAKIKDIDGITYMNSGDFCESCTALIETVTGNFEIVRSL